jgi:hypothetical protein
VNYPHCSDFLRSNDGLMDIAVSNVGFSEPRQAVGVDVAEPASNAFFSKIAVDPAAC